MKSPRKIQGQTAVANLLKSRFDDRVTLVFNRQLIQRWRQGRFIPAGIEPFPKPDDGNRYAVAACVDWMERFIEARKRNPELLRTDETIREAKARRERAMANREQRADEHEARMTIERDTMKQDLCGIIRRLKPADVREEVQAFCCDRLRDLGLAEEVIHGFALKLAGKMAAIKARRDARFADAEAQVLADG